MVSYAHTKLIKAMSDLCRVPEDNTDLKEWFNAERALEFIATNQPPNELTLYAVCKSLFIHTTAIPEVELPHFDDDGPGDWGGNPYISVASYVYGGGRPGVWIERLHEWRDPRHDGGPFHFLFRREFEGWSGSGRSYLELNQEYAHLCGIHFRPEHQAYCRFDDSGDLEQVVSITDSDDNDDITGVTFAWKPLEMFLAASQSVLVRRFDFTHVKNEHFSGWSDRPERFGRRDDNVFYRQKIDSQASYTAGVQILRIARPRDAIFQEYKDGPREDRYVELIIHDWRHQRVTKVSTELGSTTNYFEAAENNLPFEVSPAYFRPEVILKYKGDTDKYTVTDRDITCRSAWYLKSYGVNEAGQVYAYICDLRNLSYTELLHWLAHNEEPKAGLPTHAVERDFEGRWSDDGNSLRKLIAILQKWRESGVTWWIVSDESLFGRISTPRSSSKDEWAEAFLALSKLLIEGFKIRELRRILNDRQIPFDKGAKSITLLELLLKDR